MHNGFSPTPDKTTPPTLGSKSHCTTDFSDAQLIFDAYSAAYKELRLQTEELYRECVLEVQCPMKAYQEFHLRLNPTTDRVAKYLQTDR